MYRRGTKSTLTGNDHSILLQTANGFIGDPKEEKLEEIKMLLDSCSQQTSITQRIAAKLQLSHVRKINMTIKAFGSNQCEMMRIKEYQVVMKPLDKSTSMYVKALAVPRIFAPLSTQNIALAVEKNEFLRNLNLADNGDNKVEVGR